MMNRQFLIFLFLCNVLGSFGAARTAYVDFGNTTYPTTDEGWNNMTNAAAGQMIALKDADANSFGSLTITKAFAGVNTLGADRTTEAATFAFSGNPSIDSFYGQSGNKSGLKLTGLNPSARYSFTLYAVRNGITTIDNRETKFVVKGLNGDSVVALVDATNNRGNAAVANYIAPTESGEITIDVSAGSNNNSTLKNYYINAMKIVETTDKVVVSNDGVYLSGDIMEPWCGGPAYNVKWANGISSNSSYFPITVFYQQTFNAPNYKNAGVNLYNYLGPGSTAPMASFDALQSTGLSVMNPYADKYRDYSGASIIKSWYIDHDEPDNVQPSDDPKYPSKIVPSDSTKAEYQRIVASDPTRPVMMGLGQGAAVNTWYGRGITNQPRDYRRYAKNADIVSFDTYPMNERPAISSDAQYIKDFRNELSEKIWYVANGVDNLRAATDYKKPIWVWIETTNIHTYPNTNYPTVTFNLTPAHIKAEVWMALIHGARGIGYFCHVLQPSVLPAGLLDASNAANLKAVREVNASIAANATILNTQTVANGATANTGNPASPVDVMVKRTSGFTYVYAVSMRPGTPTATFTLRNLVGARTVEVVGENRSLIANNGVFQDAFANYGVHIYKVSTANEVGITASTATIANLNYKLGVGPSTEQMFTVYGSALQSDIKITPSANVEISYTSGVGFANSPLTLVQNAGEAAATNVYVRLKAGLSTASYAENIQLTATNATTKTVSCSGKVIDPATPAQVVKIGFGPKSIPTTGYNIVGVLGSSAIALNTPIALNDSLGTPTAIKIAQTTGIAYQQGAPATPTVGVNYTVPYFEPNICYSWNYNFSASTSFELTGFASTDDVELNLLSSRGNNGSTPYTTSRLCNFSAIGAGPAVSVTGYEPAANYTKVAMLSHIKPDANGKITLTIESATGATLLNAMRIAYKAGDGTPVINTKVDSKFAAYYFSGQLIVGNYSGLVSIYDMTGRTISKGMSADGRMNLALKQGFYIVKTNAGTAKIGVK